MALKSQQELLDDFINELQSQDPSLTDTNEGSIIDTLGGVVSTAVSEIQQIAIDEFRKTFFSTANGPEITGGSDDLQTLAVDHFGDSFARPAASKATGTVTFSRANTDAGDCDILAGTIVKTPPSAAGKSIRFETTADVTMTGTSINASVRATVAGTDGNVLSGKVTKIETSLTDPSIVVTNSAAFAGGAAAETDSQYRETIRNLIESLRGATLSAIKAKALTVDGVENATAVEFLQYVREINLNTLVATGTYFGIPRVKLYIADSNGVASGALISDVEDAVETTRAAGVLVEVLAATALSQNWTATLTLNPSGPNFTELSASSQRIKDDMRKYIQDLAIGDDFVRATANAYIMSIWGPSGTNDLTNFTTSVPSGDISVTEVQKLIPGTVSTV